MNNDKAITVVANESKNFSLWNDFKNHKKFILPNAGLVYV
jgi:uncharacterized protein YbdZ (MbtH family)